MDGSSRIRGKDNDVVLREEKKDRLFCFVISLSFSTQSLSASLKIKCTFGKLLLRVLS